MTLLEKLDWLREECYHDLNSWQQGFIEDVHDTIHRHADEVTEEEVKEFLTRRQIEKIEEIWEEVGL